MFTESATPLQETRVALPRMLSEVAAVPAAPVDPAALVRGVCQSELFDCAQARGAIFPERTTTYALFADPRLASLFAFVGGATRESKILYALPYARFGTPSEITPILCTLSGGDGNDDLAHVISRAGEPPIIVGVHRYYMIDLAHSVVDAVQHTCRVQMIPLTDPHHCAGNYRILAAHAGFDANQDGVEDAVGLGACEQGDAQQVSTFFDLLASQPGPAAYVAIRAMPVPTFHLPNVNFFSALRVLPKTDVGVPGRVDINIAGRMALADGGQAWSHACAINHAESAAPIAACADTVHATTGLAEPLAWAKSTTAQAGKPLGLSVGTRAQLCHHTGTGAPQCTAAPLAHGAVTMRAVVVAPHGLGNTTWPADVAVADTKYIRLLQVQSTATDLTVAPRVREVLPGFAPLDNIIESADVAIGAPSHVLSVDINGHGGDELCALYTAFVATQAQASVMVCHMNRNETPVVSLQAVAPAPADGSSPTQVTLQGSGEDPTDDALRVQWKILDRHGSDVTAMFAVNGFVATWIAHTPGATSLFERLGALFIARAYAASESLAFPIRAELLVCDSADACTQTAINYGTVPVEDSTPHLNSENVAPSDPTPAPTSNLNSENATPSDPTPTPVSLNSENATPSDPTPTPLNLNSENATPADSTPTPLNLNSENATPSDPTPTPQLNSENATPSEPDASPTIGPSEVLLPGSTDDPGTPPNIETSVESTATPTPTEQTLLNLDPASPASTPTPQLTRLSTGTRIGEPWTEPMTARVVEPTADRIPPWVPAVRATPTVAEELPPELLPHMSEPPLMPFFEPSTQAQPTPPESPPAEMLIDTTRLPQTDTREAVAPGATMHEEAAPEKRTLGTDEAISDAPPGFAFGGGGCSLLLTR